MYPVNNNEFIEIIERAKIQIEVKEYRFALDYLQKAIELFDDRYAVQLDINECDLYNLSGNIALLINEIETARGYFEYALNKNPQSSQACLGLGEVFFNLENFEPAKKMFEWSIYTDPDNVNALQALAKANSVLGLLPDDNSLLHQDEDTFQEPKMKDNNPGLLLSRAANSLLNKRYEEAKSLIESAEGLFNGQLTNPTNSEFASTFYNIKGFIHLSLDDIVCAKDMFEKSLRLNPESSQACTGLAEILLIEGLQKSKTMFEWGVKNNPANAVAVEGLKKVSNLLHHPDNDISKSPVSPNELGITELLDKAYIFFGEKNYTEALEILTISEKLLPEEDMKIRSAVESLKGFSYLGLNNLDSAKDFFERALFDEPDSSDACAGLGEVFHRSGLGKEAKTMFEWAIKYNAENKFAHAGLSKVNNTLGFENHHNLLIQEYN